MELADLHPKKAFMSGALEKEVRLSFANRIRQTLPAPYQVFIPESKDNEVPEFKYNNAGKPLDWCSFEYYTNHKKLLHSPMKGNN